jgi:hypothetical protein
VDIKKYQDYLNIIVKILYDKYGAPNEIGIVRTEPGNIINKKIGRSTKIHLIWRNGSLVVDFDYDVIVRSDTYGFANYLTLSDSNYKVYTIRPSYPDILRNDEKEKYYDRFREGKGIIEVIK